MFEKQKNIKKQKKLNVQYIEKKTTQDQSWTMRQLHDNASRIYVMNQSNLLFGFPLMTQIIYPFQTCQIATGWKLEDIPQKTMMHTLPHSALLDNQLVSFSTDYTTLHKGNQISQTLLNTSQYPIKIQTNFRLGKRSTRICKLHPQTLEQLTDVDIGHLIGALLGAAAEILPFFI